jgi:outer membrane lipoprotein-sorting protein
MLVGLMLLLLAAPAVAEETPNTWYAERIISGDTPPIVEHLWSKGPKLRAETVIRGHPIVTLVNGERYMTLDKILNTGVSIQRSPDAIREDTERSRPFGNEGSILQEAGGEKVSIEKVGGRPCELYRLTNNEGRQEVCVSRDQARLPLQFKVWRRKSGKEALTRYLDWTSGIEIPDDFFEPDSSVKLEHVSHEDYLRRAGQEQIGPAPPFFRGLLHGTR